MSWNPLYIVLIFFSTLIDYAMALMIDRTSIQQHKRILLFCSLFSNLFLLFIFKYYHFFRENWIQLTHWQIPEHDWLLPVGISFYTFQTMSYTIDVYRGELKAERHFGMFALYVSFFPQLVAGPIERASHLLPQLRQVQKMDAKNFTGGLKLIAWGMFKKVVIADRLALFVNQVYQDPQQYEGLPLVIATIFFALQIYCDFSGYSDIAMGSAQMMGIDLMENFRRPYHAKNVKDFWNRWHISLSSWFRSYVYIPLGGNRVMKWRWYYNLLITFLVSGIWHGANWTFVIWGLLHGLYLVGGIATSKLYQKVFRFIAKLSPFLAKLIQVTSTFSLVCFAWIFFRANSVNDAFYVCTHLFSNFFTDIWLVIYDVKYEKSLLRMGHSVENFNTALWAILLMEIIHWLQRKEDMRNMFAHKPVWLRWTLYLLMVLAILNFGMTEEVPFIYFQF
jgi:alginate O-acetyltransferase complex protein AlgI